VPGAELDLVVRYRKGQTYGVHALIAALETEPPSVPYRLHLARTVEEVTERVRTGVSAGRRVLTAWSFYSPDAPGVQKELVQVRGGATSGSGRVVNLAGGVHATAEPLATLRSGFDAVAIGEGEATFTAVVDAFGTDRDWRDLPGIAVLDDAGALRRGSAAVRWPLDHYPAFPHTRNLTSPIEITRGCVYACRFCQTPFMFSARFRHRSVASVREQVRVIRERGLRDVRFITPTSLSYGSPDTEPAPEAVQELLAACQEEIGPHGRVFFGSFPSELRPEHVTAPTLRMLRRYVANRDVIIGAQSGSDDVLALSGRGHGAAAAQDAVRLAVQEGFRPSVDVIFGMPGEGEAEALDTVAMIRRLAGLGARIHAHTFLPLPGTPWRDEPPGRIPDAARRALAELTAGGRVYGSWERQERVAAELADARTSDRDADRRDGRARRRPRELRIRTAALSPSAGSSGSARSPAAPDGAARRSPDG
jgi:B12-binding domain/radical SAM domain protein